MSFNPSSELLVLVVDDNPMDQLIVKKAMEPNDIQIDTADSGEEARDMVFLKQYSLIICDISMPELSGFDFLEFLKSWDELSHIPLVFLTNNEETNELAEKAFELGAIDVISKGVSPAKLKGRLSVLIDQDRYKKSIIEEQIKAKSEREIDAGILENAIPKYALDQIRNDKKTENKKLENASVMFADFVDFTKHSKNAIADDIVKRLDSYYSVFDEISKRLRIEKIKTIGDSYMCAGGVIDKDPQNPFLVILGALEMRDYVLERAADDIDNGIEPWYIKFGIATGEVVSGILGTTNYHFDIWGDTVNVASRIEGICPENMILISPATNSIIQPLFETISKGKFDLKNWGELELFSVTHIKKEYAASQDGQYPNRKFYETLEELD